MGGRIEIRETSVRAVRGLGRHFQRLFFIFTSHSINPMFLLPALLIHPPPFPSILCLFFFFSYLSSPNCSCSRLYQAKDANMKPASSVSHRGHCVHADHMNSVTRYTTLGQAHRRVRKGGQTGTPSIASRVLVPILRHTCFLVLVKWSK